MRRFGYPEPDPPTQAEIDVIVKATAGGGAVRHVRTDDVYFRNAAGELEVQSVVHYGPQSVNFLGRRS